MFRHQRAAASGLIKKGPGLVARAMLQSQTNEKRGLVKIGVNGNRGGRWKLRVQLTGRLCALFHASDQVFQCGDCHPERGIFDRSGVEPKPDQRVANRFAGSW